MSSHGNEALYGARGRGVHKAAKGKPLPDQTTSPRPYLASGVCCDATRELTCSTRSKRNSGRPSSGDDIPRLQHTGPHETSAMSMLDCRQCGVAGDGDPLNAPSPRARISRASGLLSRIPIASEALLVSSSERYDRSWNAARAWGRDGLHQSRVFGGGGWDLSQRRLLRPARSG
jgi:hypothetical protein